MATHSDEEDMPLAKRQRRLFQERGMYSKLQELSDTGKTVSPDPSDVIIILDDSDDGSAPGAPPEPSHSDPPRSESPRQPDRTPYEVPPAAQDDTPPIEQQPTEIEEIELCTTSEDEHVEPEVEEAKHEATRTREPQGPSRLSFAPQATQNFRQATRYAPPPPQAPQPVPRRQSPPTFNANHPAVPLDAPYEFSLRCGF